MKARRDKGAEAFALAGDLTVPDVEFARQVIALTKRMNDINRAFVINFAGLLRHIARENARKAAGL